jgi:hypothetical protein
MNGKHRIVFLILTVSLPILLLGSLSDQSDPASDGKKTRLALAERLYQAQLHGRNMAKDFFGLDVKVEIFRPDEGMIYFSIPIGGFVREELEKITIYPERIQWGYIYKYKKRTELGKEPKEKRQELGTYVFYSSVYYYFRMAVNDLRIQ